MSMPVTGMRTCFAARVMFDLHKPKGWQTYVDRRQILQHDRPCRSGRPDLFPHVALVRFDFRRLTAGDTATFLKETAADGQQSNLWPQRIWPPLGT